MVFLRKKVIIKVLDGRKNMCGIIGYSGKVASASPLFSLMQEQKHRGEDDGFGFLDVNKKTIFKTLLTLDELEENKVDETKLDKHRKERNLKKDLKFINNLKSKRGGIMILHHRKASNGSVEIKNTHPFQIDKDTCYMHNGTTDDFEALRNYFELFEDVKCESETDSEFLGRFTENLLSLGYTLSEALGAMEQVFYEVGVLIKINMKTKEIHILKDFFRSLYVYVLNDVENSILFMSEPSFKITEFKKCYRILQGVVHINKTNLILDDCTFEDITKQQRYYITWPVHEIRCDACSTLKPIIKVKFPKTRWNAYDVCLDCLHQAWKPKENDVKNYNYRDNNNAANKYNVLNDVNVHVVNDFGNGIQKQLGGP